MKDIDWNSRKTFEDYSKIKIEECAGCEKIIDALGYQEEIKKVCTDTACWKKKERAKENEQIRDAKKQTQDFEAVKNIEIRRVIDGRFSRDHMVYMAIEMLRNPASSSKWTSTKVQEAAMEEFGIPFRGNLYQDQGQKYLYDQLHVLDDTQLVNLIFYCALRGLDVGSRSLFDLTLGAAAGDGEDSPDETV